MILLNGVYDLTHSQHDFDQHQHEDKLFTQESFTFMKRHLGISTEQYSLPLFSPYFEPNLQNLPSTTIIVGEYDGLRSDSEAFYKKSKEAGNQVEKIVLPGQTHCVALMRKTMIDGDDPAEIIATIFKKHTK